MICVGARLGTKFAVLLIDAGFPFEMLWRSGFVVLGMCVVTHLLYMGQCCGGWCVGLSEIVGLRLGQLWVSKFAV